jgi:hypothetical protein
MTLKLTLCAGYFREAMFFDDYGWLLFDDEGI